MNAHSMDDILSGAAKAGWDWFEKVDPAITRAVDIDQSKDQQDSQAISRAWAEFSRTPGGAKALEKLFDTTLRRTVFFVSLGLDPQSMAVFGAFREGQNAVAHEIARQIGIGNREAIAPRDV